jgi:hypothetical protein
MVTWVAGMDSPDRMDAAVPALTQLADPQQCESECDAVPRWSSVWGGADRLPLLRSVGCDVEGRSSDGRGHCQPRGRNIQRGTLA